MHDSSRSSSCAVESDSLDLSTPIETDTSFQPVFVVGCERSGTTLMAVLLDRHPDLAMTPETFFFQKVVPRHRSAELTHERALQRFSGWFMTRDLEIDHQRLRQRFSRHAPTYANLFRSVMEEYARGHGKTRAGEKTPFHLWQVPLLLEWFPEAKVIGMVRDGRDVALSILKMPWTTHKILRLHCRKWVRTVKTELRYQRRYPERFKLVRYEDVLREPARMLREITGFLGMDFTPAQLEPGQETRVVVSRALGYKADALGKLDASRIAGWRTKATRGQMAVMNAMMGPMLRRMGYPEWSMESYSAGERAFHGAANLGCCLGLHRLWYNLFMRRRAKQRRQAEERELERQACDA